MERTLIQHIAHQFARMQNQAKDGQGETGGAEALRALIHGFMPSGSGFYNGTRLDAERSAIDRLVFNTSFHHMDDGLYCGWSDYEVIVKPDFINGFDVDVRGRNVRDIKDYIADCFRDALGQRIVMAWNKDKRQCEFTYA